jgi:threonine dehydrogenase-like Zn-dependent dehydrogenase
MRATLIYGAGDVRGEDVPDPKLQEPTDAVVRVPVGEDSALLPSLLTLSDVFPTGHHCAVKAGVGPRTWVARREALKVLVRP